MSWGSLHCLGCGSIVGYCLEQLFWPEDEFCPFCEDRLVYWDRLI